MANSFNLIELDFASIKESLKDYLSQQEVLKDYDFTGSVLNTVLDVLAYNTHYTAFYANMVANEMFLDSSILRKSVVSHAKQIGYTPTSSRASRAIMDIQTGVTGGILNRGVEFTGTGKDNKSYKFVCLQTNIANINNVFENVSIFQGTLKRITYVYDPLVKSRSILSIPNNKVDTRTILVRVQDSSTDTTGINELWGEASNYISLSPTSSVYFLQESSEEGMYELYFGDNFFGKQPKAGSMVFIDYLETEGELGNDITEFSTSLTNAQIIANTSSGGGASAESISSIKFLAPRQYVSQNRAVTQEDYYVSIIKKYPNFDSVKIYGGETVTPPKYGKVLIAIKPKAGLFLTALEKDEIESFVKTNFSIVTISPEVIDPEYIFLNLDISLRYDLKINPVDKSTMKTFIVGFVKSWATSNLKRFGDSFYSSVLLSDLSRSDISVVSCDFSVVMTKTISEYLIRNAKGFSVDFKNKLKITKDPVIKTSSFSHLGIFGNTVSEAMVMDNSFGVLNVVSVDSDGVVDIVYPSVGKVDYKTGICDFNTKFSPIVFINTFKVTAKPEGRDILASENNIIELSENDLVVDIVQIN